MTDENYNEDTDSFDVDFDGFNDDSDGFGADSGGFDDDSILGECNGNSDSCPSKSRMNKLQGNCNRCGIAYGGSESGRVINGRPVRPVYKYPWIVSSDSLNYI
ncbi:hypothetical protein AVEN_218415-1 [Araneus ventricosus]|uniref:Uncharacterized protein n=1 Tax=Araneus ventricosus TaxID=182803 RepID=A0A4Y2MW72_ARAVE|nr:hypothetical protein AVEN_218415-1 [Araneus ventricosus]